MRFEGKAITILITVSILIAAVSRLAAQEKEKPRVYITESKSWEISGGVGGAEDAVGGGVSGGARPQTAEIIKTFREKCRDTTVTLKQEKADYIVVLEHEGGKSAIRKDNKFAVFKKDGDSIESGSTRSLGNAVKQACEALIANWKTVKE